MNENYHFKMFFKEHFLKFLIILFYAFIFIIGEKQVDAIADISIRKAVICFALWLFLLLLNTLSSKVNTIILFMIAIWVGTESTLGLFHIIKKLFFADNISGYIGSFLNPGPYGGFLAVGISILLPYVVEQKTISTFFKSFLFVELFITILVLSFTNSRAAVLSLFISLTFFFVRDDRVVLFLKKHFFIIIFFVVFICTWGYYAKRPSADGRLFMDKICIHAIVDNKGKGPGLGKYVLLYENAQENFFRKNISIEKGVLDIKNTKEKDRFRACDPMVSFNSFLLIGVEMGIIPMVLFFLIISTTIILLNRKCSPFYYGLLAFSVFGLFSYPLQLWQFQLLGTVMIADASSLNSLTVCSIKKKYVIYLLVIPVLLMYHNIEKALHTAYEYRDWKRNSILFELEEYQLYSELCSEKYDILRYVPNFMLEYGLSLSKEGNINKSDSIFIECQSYYTSPLLLSMLGDNCTKKGDFYSAEKYYIDSFVMLPDRITPLYKLSKLYELMGDTIASINMINCAKDFRCKVESELTEKVRESLRNLEKELSIVYNNSKD